MMGTLLPWRMERQISWPYAPGERKVEQDAVGACRQSLDRGVRERLAAKAFVPLKFEHTHKIFPQGGIVLDNEQPRHRSPSISNG